MDERGHTYMWGVQTALVLSTLQLSGALYTHCAVAPR